jgi:hypothetical protein
LENHNSLTVTPNLVILEPTISLQCVDIIMHSVMMFDVMLISLIPCLFVLLRVDEQVTEDLCTQQVENTEQELIEGKLCP